jgi:hypothetical protein
MAAVSCRYNLQKDLWPGSCIEIDTSQPSVAGGGPPWPNGGQCGILEQGHRTLYVNYDLSTNTQPIAECGDGNGTGSGCDNNMSDTKTNGSGCGVGGSNSCGAPPPTTPQLPGLSNWSVTYSCVPAE